MVARDESRTAAATRKRSRLTGIRKRATTDQVRQRIQQAIEEGEFGPGERLPSEREFVERLGVSRVSVREAIRALEAIGMVEVFHGRGSFVAPDRNNAYANSFRNWLSLHRDEVLDLLRIRGALDELAAELAAERHHQAETAAVEAAQAAFRAAAGEDPPQLTVLIERDVAFHDAIAAATGSALLVDLLGDLHSYMAESRQATLAPRGRPVRSADEHDAIVAGIASGDSARARTAAARHVESVREAIIETLGAPEHG